MSEFLRNYLTVAIFGGVAVALLAGVLGLGSLIRPNRRQDGKYMNYESGVDPVGDLWAASAEAWADLRRPFRAAYARWREAEARLAVGVSADSLGALRSAHAAAQALGARRLVEEV